MTVEWKWPPFRRQQLLLEADRDLSPPSDQGGASPRTPRKSEPQRVGKPGCMEYTFAPAPL